MASPALETVVAPFTAFNFAVEISVPGVSEKVCNAAFAECDGLEMTMDIKTIREGGNNTSQIRLTGAVSYALLTLKRGMTDNFDLWKWAAALYAPHGSGLRGTARVVVLAPDGKTRMIFALDGVLPAKLKAPALNARDGAIAIEELQLAYESMKPEPPE